MLHFKIIGLIWLLLSLIAAVVFAPELWSIAADRTYGFGTGFHDTGFWVSQFFVEGFLLVGVLVGFGLIRFRRWAAICTRITAVLLLLYCVAFLLMGEFIHYDFAWLMASLFGLVFAAYSLFVVWRFRPYGPGAEPGTSPNGGPVEPPGSSSTSGGPPSVS